MAETTFHASFEYGDRDRPQSLLQLTGAIGFYFDRSLMRWVADPYVFALATEDIDYVEVTKEQAADIEARFRNLGG